MTAYWQEPRRRCLKIKDWPLPDQAMWQEVNRQAAPFDNPGRGSHWRPATRERYRKSYGRWLACLTDHGLLAERQEPADRVTIGHVRAYVEELDDQVSARTVTGRVIDLCNVMLAAVPDRDWQWLKDIRARLTTKAENSARPKTDRVISTARLVDWGVARMDEAQNSADIKERYRAVYYRDGFMIALLALCPLRRKNFTSIEIGRHLIEVGSNHRLYVPGEETKTGVPEDSMIPGQLTESLRIYLDTVRPSLLREPASDRLWISQNGTAMTESSIHHRITKLTEQAFGIAISPHLFRDCAATTLVLNDPKNARSAAALLNHRSYATTERHYIQGQSLDASTRFGTIVDELRASLDIVLPDKFV